MFKLLYTLVTLFAALYLVAAGNNDGVYLEKKDSAVIRRRQSPGKRGNSHNGGHHHCRPRQDDDDCIRIILEREAQDFCSSFLHLPTTATATATVTTFEVVATLDVTFTSTSDPGTTTVPTTTTTSTSITTLTTVFETTTDTITTTTTTTSTAPAQPHKRDIPVPSWLPFPSSVISRACSHIVTPTTTSITSTTTATFSLTTTGVTTITTTLPFVTETSTVVTTETDTISSTTTSTDTTSTTTTTTAIVTVTPPSTISGKIKVSRVVDHNTIGFLQLTNAQDRYLVGSAASADTFTSSTPFNNFVDSNAPASHPFLAGLISPGVELSPSNSNAAILGGAPVTTSFGSTPQSGGSVSIPGSEYETAIFIFDGISTISAQWVNHAGTLVVISIVWDPVGQTLYLTANPAAVILNHPGAEAVEFSLV